jgi:hypothetical protein
MENRKANGQKANKNKKKGHQVRQQQNKEQR